MEQKGFRRKLTAILSADVAGYSRLMQDDEAATVKTLEAYKQIISDLVKQYRGRVVDSPGDNLLAEFASVVDAVQCAVATQKELQARNTELPENRKMQFRIGVNLGDVIEEESRIYGDGVNIAARLESIADPGGICISNTAFDHIETKLPFGYAYLGEQTVKNIAKPVGAYKVLMEPRVISDRESEKKSPVLKGWTFGIAGVAALIIIVVGTVWHFFWRGVIFEPASKDKMAFTLPDKPSIAVLPFGNKSEDPRMDLFCDGITGVIITTLSSSPQIFVIARGSSNYYKGKNLPSAKEVSEGLGVQYILEGNIQKSGDRIRSTVQLIDALKGRAIWAETFDRDLTDTFALQDEIALKVMTSIRSGFGQSDLKPAFMQKYFKGTQGLDCYLNLMQAMEYIQAWNKEDNDKAGEIIEDVLTMCPDNPWAYRLLSWHYHHNYYLGPIEARQEALEKSIKTAQKALVLEPSLADPHSLMCSIYLIKGDLENALAECQLGVSLNPGSMDALSELGHALTFAGKFEEAMTNFEKAIRINPLGKASLFRGIGVVFLLDGHLEKAVSSFKTAIQRSPKDLSSNVCLTVAYSLMGSDREASKMAAEVLKLNPNYTPERFLSGYMDQEKRNLYINALRKAGLSGKPKAPQP
jgi:adenylate cyclase